MRLFFRILRVWQAMAIICYGLAAFIMWDPWWYRVIPAIGDWTPGDRAGVACTLVFVLAVSAIIAGGTMDSPDRFDRRHY